MSNALANWNSTSNAQTGGHRPMLGQLLVGAGVVGENAMQECLVKAKSASARIGETLVRDGHIDSECLQSTLLAQNLVSTGAVTQRTALRLIASTTRNRIPLSKLTEETDHLAQPAVDNSLTTLLVESDLVKREVITQVKTQCKGSQRGLTQTLQSIGSLSNRDLDSAFHALSMLCDSEITKQQATVALRMAHQQNRRVQDFLPETQYPLAKAFDSNSDLATTLQDLEAYKPSTTASAASAKESIFAAPEFAIALGTIMLVLGTGLGNHFLVPVEFKFLGFCLIAFVASVLMMVVGIMLHRRFLKTQTERELRLSDARDTKSRLSKLRQTSC